MNENENTTTQNLWDTVKAVLRGRVIEAQAYLKEQEKNKIKNLTLHLKQVEKEEMENITVSRENKFGIISLFFNLPRLDLRPRM